MSNNSDMIAFLKEYITDTIKKLVDDKNSIEVLISPTTKSVIIQLRVNKADIGKIIGKQGRIIESLKILVSAIRNANYPNDPRKIIVEILEDESSSFNYNK